VANCPEGPVWNRRISRATASSNFDDSYHIDPVLSIIKCYHSNENYEPGGRPTRSALHRVSMSIWQVTNDAL
jgi:hypothetical protein